MICPGDCTVARRMAARMVGPGFDYLRGELRAGRAIPRDVLLSVWEVASRDA